MEDQIVRVVSFVGVSEGVGVSTVVGIAASGLATSLEVDKPTDVDVVDWGRGEAVTRWWGATPSTSPGSIRIVDAQRWERRDEDRINFVLFDSGGVRLEWMRGLVCLVVDPVMNTEAEIEDAKAKLAANTSCVLLATVHNRSSGRTGDANIGGVIHVPHSLQAHINTTKGQWPIPRSDNGDDDAKLRELRSVAAALDWLCLDFEPHDDTSSPRWKPYAREQPKAHAWDLPVEINSKFKAIGRGRGDWFEAQLEQRHDELADPDNPIVAHVPKDERVRQRINLPPHVVEHVNELAKARYCSPWQIAATVIARSPAPNRSAAKRLRY